VPRPRESGGDRRAAGPACLAHGAEVSAVPEDPRVALLTGARCTWVLANENVPGPVVVALRAAVTAGYAAMARHLIAKVLDVIGQAQHAAAAQEGLAASYAAMARQP